MDKYSISDIESLVKKYSGETECIDGLETHIISVEHYSKIINVIKEDTLLTKRLISYIEIATSVKKIELLVGVAYNPKIYVESLQWWPVLCYKHGDKLYHVDYRKKWICKDCYYDNHEVIMQLVMSEPDIYIGMKRPEQSSLFKKIPCKNCGHLLQNYLIELNN